MTSFFEIFGAQITNNYLISIIIAALKKEPLLYTGLNRKKGDKFDAFIDIKFNKEKEFEYKDNKDFKIGVVKSVEFVEPYYNELKELLKYIDIKER